MNPQLRRFATPMLWLGTFFFVLPAAVRTYFLSVFPGSQDADVIGFIFYLDRTVLPLQIIGAAMMALALFKMFNKNNLSARISVLALVLVSITIWYLSEFKFSASHMFPKPHAIAFVKAMHSSISPQTVVLGVEANGVAKAYPVQYLAYHHAIADSLGAQPVLVTFCVLCKTGRVFDPMIDGRVQQFRLVGARLHNAVIEDAETKSWWYQATGEAAAGPRTGMHLTEIKSKVEVLQDWTDLHPASLLFLPDSAYRDEYENY